MVVDTPFSGAPSSPMSRVGADAVVPVDEVVGADADPSGGRRRRGWVVTALAIAVAAGLVGLLAYGLVARSPDTSIDDSLAQGKPISVPGFRLDVLRAGLPAGALDGTVRALIRDGSVASTELRGTPYVLNFWASWCAPCREEAPELVAGWNRWRDKGVLFVGLDMQDTAQDAERFMDQYGVRYLNLRDPTDATARRFGVTGIPETFFIDRRGRIVGHVIGVVSPAQLAGGVQAALSGTPRTAGRGGDVRSAG